jgi:FkbM family methyltransferase
MIKLFKPFTSLFRLYKKTKSFRLSYDLLPWHPTPVVYPPATHKNGNIVLTDSGKEYTAKQVALFAKHGELLAKFLNSGNISFLPGQGSDDKVNIDINGQQVKININSYDNLKVVEEVFIDQLYDFHSKDKYVVCDVGMNIGAASLYFASFENVERVYGYEPFRNTFELARKNISLNENIGAKIEVFNFGLGAKDTTLQVPKPAHGFLGGTTSGFVIDTLADDLKKEAIDVEIKNICGQIQYIKSKHPGTKIVLKLDCEGAEYEIIQVLKEQGILSDIEAYMIEYHFKGKKSIVDVLNDHRFFVMAPGSDRVSYYGMIYAIKNKH